MIYKVAAALCLCLGSICLGEPWTWTWEGAPPAMAKKPHPMADIQLMDADFYKTIPADYKPLYRFDAPERLVLIGDPHADYAALVSIFIDRKLIHPQTLKWIGGKTNVVIMGDVFDRYHESRLVQDFLIRMKREAKAVGGRTDTILGNHDIVPLGGSVGPLDWTSEADMEAYRDFRNTEYAKALVASGRFTPNQAGFLAGNHGKTRYARWNRNKDSILIVGKTMIIHAGGDKLLLNHDPAEINASVRAWVGAYQGVGARPPINTSWTVGYLAPPRPNPELIRTLSNLGFPRAFAGIVPPSMKQPSQIANANCCDTLFGIGPLWSVALWRQHLSQGLVQAILDHYDVDRIIVGHTRLERLENRYEEKVWNIDTQIGRAKASNSSGGGMLSAIEIVGNEVHKYEDIPMQVKDRWYELELKYRGNCEADYGRLVNTSCLHPMHTGCIHPNASKPLYIKA